MTILNRMTSPTPTFFKKVRNGGLLLGTIGAALLGSPGTLPPALLKIAAYLTIAGVVASAVSQAATTNDEPAKGGSQST